MVMAIENSISDYENEATQEEFERLLPASIGTSEYTTYRIGFNHGAKVMLKKEMSKLKEKIDELKKTR